MSPLTGYGLGQLALWISVAFLYYRVHRLERRGRR